LLGENTSVGTERGWGVTKGEKKNAFTPII